MRPGSKRQQQKLPLLALLPRIEVHFARVVVVSPVGPIDTQHRQAHRRRLCSWLSHKRRRERSKESASVYACMILPSCVLVSLSSVCLRISAGAQSHALSAIRFQNDFSLDHPASRRHLNDSSTRQEGQNNNTPASCLLASRLEPLYGSLLSHAWFLLSPFGPFTRYSPLASSARTPNKDTRKAWTLVTLQHHLHRTMTLPVRERSSSG